MNTFYSILYFNIRPEINEKLSVGLLIVNESGIQFSYSKSKLNTIKSLVSSSIHKAALNYLKYISESVHRKEVMDNDGSSFNFNVNSRYDKVFSNSYIDYLSRYNNNLLTFTKPKILDTESNNNLFNLLYEKFVDTITVKEVDIKNDVLNQFKKSYYPKIKPYFSINKSIDSTRYKDLLTPIKLDLLGRNEKEVFGQSIDFSNQIISLEHNVSKLIHLHYAIPEATKFIIGKEPEREKDTNHRIWNNVRSNKDFKYVDISEADEIEEYAKKHGVTPLFTSDKGNR